MINFRKFNEEFFNKLSEIQTTLSSPKWQNEKGIVPINENTNASIEISLDSTKPVMGHYEGYRVKIVSKKSGLLEETYFPFNIYFKEGKSFQEDIFTSSKKNEGFLIKNYDCKDNIAKWYFLQPTDDEKTKMVKEIYKYIHHWT